MRKTLMIGVSAISMFMASQQAFAFDSVSKLRSSTTTPDVVNFQTMNKPAGAMNEFQKARNGNLSGVGVPGGFGTRDSGAAIMKSAGIGKEPGLGAVGPSPGALGKAQQGVSDLKNTQGRTQGVQGKEGASARQSEGMQKALSVAAGQRGNVKGVNAKETASAAQTQVMKQAIDDYAASRGNKKGIEAKTDGFKLSAAQLKQIKDGTINPKVNPNLASSDPKKDPKHEKEVKEAKKVFDFVKPKDYKVGFDWAKYEPKMPKPPKPN